MAIDLVTVVNLVLAMTICAVGFWEYGKSRNTVAFYLGAAFAFFGMSHVITLAGLAAQLGLLLMVVHIVGYVLVLFALLYHMTPEAAPEPPKKKK